MTTRRPPARQRSDLLDLRTSVRENQHLLDELSAFETIWLEFRALLEILIGIFDDREWDPYDRALTQESRETLADADELRLKLESRQAILLPDYKDPLAHVLRTSLRRAEHAREVTKLFGREIWRDALGQLREYSIHANEFVARMTECQALIHAKRHQLEVLIISQRARIEEQERMLTEERAHELALATARTGPPPGVWAALRASRFGKAFWWLFEGSVRWFILGLIVLGVLAVLPTPIRGFLVRLFESIKAPS